MSEDTCFIHATVSLGPRLGFTTNSLSVFGPVSCSEPLFIFFNLVYLSLNLLICLFAYSFIHSLIEDLT